MDRRALRKRLLYAYAGTFAAFCSLLFWPAGTVLYWQAWLYIAVFLGMGLAVSLVVLRDDPALLAGRLTLTPLAEPDPAQKIIQCCASVLFVAMMILCGARRPSAARGTSLARQFARLRRILQKSALAAAAVYLVTAAGALSRTPSG